MKHVFLFIVFFSSFLYSHSQEKTDSIAYYSNLSDTNIKANKYKHALYYTQKAINYSETIHKTESQATLTCNLGKIYFDLKKYDEAINTFNKCIVLYKTLPASATYASVYYYLGISYIKKENYAVAEFCLNKAQSINESLKIPDTAELVSLQKGILYKAKGNHDLASAIFKTIIAIPDSPAILDSKSEALYQIGTIETAKNRNNLALNYFNKALELNAKNKNLEQKSNILLALSSVFEKMLDKNNAYSYLKQHLNLKESLSISNDEKLGIDDYDKFKEAQRLKEIVQMEKEQKQQEKESKFNKLISILAIALISILSLLSLSLYKNNIIRTRTNLLLEEKNKELIIAKEKAEKASNARTEFLSIVSHELRTPLNAINGITHLLLEDNPKESQMKYLTSLEFSGSYLTTFINEILEINRIDSDKVEIENIDFNLKQLLENIQISFKELATSNNNVFKLDIDPDIPANLIGDPTKLSQVFINLINNALKFTHDGHVCLTAKLLSLEDKNAILYFEVKDDGIGIPEDKLETVFDSFSQASVEINRKYGGTGLGLTIVRKLVTILGGKIKLESVIEKGSAFSFELQIKAGEEQIQVDAKPKIYYESALKNKKILLVEDNKINQMVSKKMLENKGMFCEIIDNGEDAVERVKNNKFDLILMDVHLPGINGTIATKQIREFDTSTPIIALTAISLYENRENLLSFGMNDVITKPFVPENFYTVIAQNI
jgi:signal transduction histidine kinase/CheY-like chemotaxis protein/Flp pilus assembly protein TadD